MRPINLAMSGTSCGCRRHGVRNAVSSEGRANPGSGRPARKLPEEGGQGFPKGWTLNYWFPLPVAAYARWVANAASLMAVMNPLVRAAASHVPIGVMHTAVGFCRSAIESCASAQPPYAVPTHIWTGGIWPVCAHRPWAAGSCSAKRMAVVFSGQFPCWRAADKARGMRLSGTASGCVLACSALSCARHS